MQVPEMIKLMPEPLNLSAALMSSLAESSALLTELMGFTSESQGLASEPSTSSPEVSPPVFSSITPVKELSKLSTDLSMKLI